jgi:hypothetical protein
LNNISEELVVDRKWKEMDFAFQSKITDQNFIRRCTYRTLLVGAANNLCLLDGIEISLSEKENGHFLLQKFEIYKKATENHLSDHKVSGHFHGENCIESSFATIDPQVRVNF